MFIPVGEKHYDFARKLQLNMIKNNVRAKIDNSDERLSKISSNLECNNGSPLTCKYIDSV